MKKRNRFLGFIYFVFLCSVFSCFAMETNNTEPYQPTMIFSLSEADELNKVGNNVEENEKKLFIFDIDLTTYVEKEKVKYVLEFDENISKVVSEEDYRFLGGQWERICAYFYDDQKNVELWCCLMLLGLLSKGAVQLIEEGTKEKPSTAQIINGLQVKGCKVIALTNQITLSENPIIKDLLQWRAGKLLSVGIDFNNNMKFYPCEDIIFHNLPANTGKSFAKYYKGIAMTAGWEKGIVLDELLTLFKQETGWEPVEIVFFDDQKLNIESVQKAVEKRRIKFQGYWYRGLERLWPLTFDRDIIRKQISHGLENSVFLTSEEVKNQKSDEK